MIRQFFRDGFSDAEQRLAGITLGAPADDPRVTQVITASRAVGAVGRVLGIVGAAAESSAFVAAGREAVERWRHLAPPAQRLAGGVTLMTAAAVHVSLTLWRGITPGWLWLILPGMAAAVGGLLLAASGSAGDGKAAR